MLIFGGWTAAGASSETWILADEVWHTVSTVVAPGPRFGHSMAASERTAVVFGGAGCGLGGAADVWSLCQDDELLWMLDLDTLVWTKVCPLELDYKFFNCLFLLQPAQR